MEAGLSQEKLAVRSGVALGTVSRAESGYEVRPDTLHRIARGLGCEVTDLMPPEGRTP